MVRFYTSLGFGNTATLDGKVGPQVVGMIQKLVAPKSWSEPAAYIATVPGAIVVRQTPAVHRQIQELLIRLGIGSVMNIANSGSGSRKKNASAGGGFGGGAF